MNDDDVRTVLDIAQPQIKAEMAQAWADGMRQGMEIAAKMAQGIIDHPEPSPEQKVIASGLRDALRECALTIEPKARP